MHARTESETTEVGCGRLLLNTLTRPRVRLNLYCSIFNGKRRVDELNTQGTTGHYKWQTDRRSSEYTPPPADLCVGVLLNKCRRNSSTAKLCIALLATIMRAKRERNARLFPFSSKAVEAHGAFARESSARRLQILRKPGTAFRALLCLRSGLREGSAASTGALAIRLAYRAGIS